MTTYTHECIRKVEQEAFNRGFRDGWSAVLKRANDTLKVHPKETSGNMSTSSVRSNPFRRGTGQARVYDYLRGNPGSKPRDIMAGADVSYKVVSNTIQRLKSQVDYDDGWRLL